VSWEGKKEKGGSTMAIMRWSPYQEMMSLRQAMDRLFDDSVVRGSRALPDIGAGLLPLDVYQTDNDVVIKATIPGIAPEEVDISITGDTVTIKGEQKEESEVKEEDYMLKERRYGAFSRSVSIPVSVKSDKADATFDNGVLTLTLPKAEEIKPKQIKIKPKAMIEGAKK
jgi:HSP20 family protein